MESRTKEMGYGNSYGFETYPGVDALQFMKRSPPGSVREYPVRPEDSVSMTAQRKESEIGTSETPQEIVAPVRPTRLRRGFWAVLGSWFWEFLSCVVAVVALAGIYVVLRKYNDQPLNDWRNSLTINTVLSILVTVIKAAIVVPLAEGISQLKWSWYRKDERALKDIVTFDEASRGAFGAAKLVLSMNPLRLASLASALFLAAFTIGPFAQQMVQISQRDVISDKTPTIQICAGRYNDIEEGPGGETAPWLVDIGLSTIGAIYDGILKNGMSPPIEISDCPSGNCTFNAYQSLGFCSRCEEITSELVAYNQLTGRTIRVEDCRPEMGCGYNLRNGTLLSSTSMGTIFNATRVLSLQHPNLRNISGIVNITAIYGERAYNKTWPAFNPTYECTLYYCVHQYETKVVDGQVKESSHEVPFRTNSSIVEPGSDDDVSMVPETCVQDGRIITPPYTAANKCEYTFSAWDRVALDQAISRLLKGFAVMERGKRPQYSSVFAQRLGRDVSDPKDTITTVFKNLAERLTKHARTSPWICQGQVKGTGTYKEAFITVRWKWFILPAVVVTATFVLLLAVIMQSRNEYIWKSSPLALVFLGMQDNRQSDGFTHPIFPSSPYNNRMAESSADIKLHLEGDGRWRIFGNR